MMIENSTRLRPYVISWNLTARCNQTCVHCYLDAGAGREAVGDADELDADASLGVLDQIAELAPEAMVILTGGEPLMRLDLLQLIEYGAGLGLWMVMGTNGFRIVPETAQRLARAGLRGVALSLESTDPIKHDAFRRIQGAWEGAVAGADALREAGLPFTIGTTCGNHNIDEIEEIAEFVAGRLQAPIWNLFFLVPAGRGAFVDELTSPQYADLLLRLTKIQKRYAGKMTLSAKCAPHYIKTLYADDPASPFIKSFAESGGCPAGMQYLGIRPNGDVTPCPYMSVFGGNLTQRSLRDIWERSPEFIDIRKRDSLEGRCGDCELNRLCGGCRARAYGDGLGILGEDRLCDHNPGTWTRDSLASLAPPRVFGLEESSTLEWTPEAAARVQRIPAFIRGKVQRSAEAWCQKHGKAQVDTDALEAIRSAMPMNPTAMFGKPRA